MMVVSINMSLINVLLLTLASLTSGIFVGRMSNYFQVYSLVLIPYLFNFSTVNGSAFNIVTDVSDSDGSLIT